MQDWKKQFVQKVELVRETARDRFDEMVESTLQPVFESLRQFTNQQGLVATATVTKPGLRTFKFAMTENAYLMVSFRLAGFEFCEVQSDSFVPGNEKHASTPMHVEFAKFDATWVQNVFQQALDHFMESYVDALSRNGAATAELIKT